MAIRDAEWDDEDELDEREYPEPDEEDEELDLLPCPHCGEEIYEEAPQCPHCGEYVTHSTHPFSSKPLWFVLLGLAGIIAVIWAFLP